jgi:hypothetical protein
VHLLDEHKPFEALNLLKENFDKKDYGKVVERVGKLFKPSNETTTIGITNETKKLLDDIRDLGIKLPRAAARVEEGEEKEQEEGELFIFPPMHCDSVSVIQIDAQRGQRQGSSGDGGQDG